MRNLLAFLAAAALTLAGVGWYLGWYQVQSTPEGSGHQEITIDFNKKKASADIKQGVEKGMERTSELRDSANKPQASATGIPTNALQLRPTTAKP